MPYHPAVHFRDQRYRKSFGGTQRLDDELLRVVADLQGLERCDSHLDIAQISSCVSLLIMIFGFMVSYSFSLQAHRPVQGRRGCAASIATGGSTVCVLPIAVAWIAEIMQLCFTKFEWQIRL